MLVPFYAPLCMVAAMIDKELANEVIDEHAKAIGYLCIYWAALEHGLDSMLEKLTPLEHGQAGNSITAHAHFNDKLKMIEALGFIRKPNKGWFASLRWTLNKIDKKLRPERNNYIHGLWIGKRPVIRRTRTNALIKRRQSRQPPTLSNYDNAPVKAENIWDMVKDVSHTQLRLNVLEQSYCEHLASLPKPRRRSNPGRS